MPTQNGPRAIQQRTLLARVLEDLEQVVAEEGASARQFESIELLAAEGIESNGVRKGFSLPENPIFGTCQNFADRAEEFCTALRAEFHSWAPDELRRRKQAQNVLAFEDLLTRLDEALRGPGGSALAESIRQKYRAALVDEFQDTDPVQYSIFDRIYQGSDATVALIGDPKQAIYAFRGADVFTYLNASRATRRQFTLRKNWRSESGLVRATTRFSIARIRSISRKSNSAPRNRDHGRIRRRCSFTVKRKRRSISGHLRRRKTSPTASRRRSCVCSTAAPRSTEKNSSRGHIAVLTSTNAQAAEMQIALRARQVPSVLYSSANVFTSHEAREMRDLLAAAAQPGNEKLVRAALCTDALGFTGNEIDALSRNDADWEMELLRFQEHHELWRDRGFIRMLRHLAVEQGVRQRLLGYPDGERRLTNFLHLSELLHAACVEHQLGMNGVLKWLGQEMQTGNTAPREECELRLESDEKAVRIITVHKSKGLEFDVVFCPYVWSDAKARAAFHDPDENYRLTLDLANNDDHKPLQEKEALAEALRLFYVAVTRAKHRCTMVWRAKTKPDRCAPAYLGSGGQPAIVSDDIAIADLPGT